MKKVILLFVLISFIFHANVYGKDLKESLDRGMISLPIDDSSLYIGWRFLKSDDETRSFDLYCKDGNKLLKLNSEKLIKTTDYVLHNFKNYIGKTIYLVNEQKQLIDSTSISIDKSYFSVPIHKPKNGITPNGEEYSYTANDVTIGDLTGNGQYDIILKWEPTNAKRPPQTGFTGNTYIDAYTLSGKMLWRIDLGVNVRSGAAYTQLLVYDFDGDGKAELICKTGDGTIDGLGKYVGDKTKDWRNRDSNSKFYGKIVEGPEYLSVFDGETGRCIDSKEYIPTRYPLDSWGGIGGNGGNDSTGGRSDRFSACVAFLEKDIPFAVMVRGWYGRTVLSAWRFNNKKLSHFWTFDSSEPEWEGYSGMANHSVTVADFNDDGLDEVCVGSMTVDSKGKGLYTTGLRHGDALHAGNFVVKRKGLEVFGAHESEGRTVAFGTPGIALYDGETGNILWSKYPGVDIGRAMISDIDPRYPGAECWATVGGTFRSDTGVEIYKSKPNSCNFAVWWDADPLRELLDHTVISKWNWKEEKTDTLLYVSNVKSNNGTKGNPCLVADILGDWREEVIWRTPENDELRIYSTTIPSVFRLPTLMSDRQYRLAIAWQNVAYNQPPHPSFDMLSTIYKKFEDQYCFDPSLFDTYWTVESQDYDLNFIQGNRDTLEIKTSKGFTLWRNEKYEGDMEISFKACLKDEGLDGDRVSDLNCFWMASDPEFPDDLFRQSSWRKGVFSRYYSLNTYYLGYGGNSNTTTRFRKYDGNYKAFEEKKKRPNVLMEYRENPNLLIPNHWYTVTIKCKNNHISYLIDGRLIVNYEDNNSYKEGWFGFRTTESRVQLTEFKATKIN